MRALASALVPAECYKPPAHDAEETRRSNGPVPLRKTSFARLSLPPASPCYTIEGTSRIEQAKVVFVEKRTPGIEDPFTFRILSENAKKGDTVLVDGVRHGAAVRTAYLRLQKELKVKVIGWDNLDLSARATEAERLLIRVKRRLSRETDSETLRMLHETAECANQDSYKFGVAERNKALAAAVEGALAQSNGNRIFVTASGKQLEGPILLDKLDAADVPYTVLRVTG